MMYKGSGYAVALQSVLDLVARRLTVSSEEFQGFLDRHSQIDCLVPEDNEKMKDARVAEPDRVSTCPFALLRTPTSFWMSLCVF